MDGLRDPGRLRAIIYVLGGKEQTKRWVERCLMWVASRGYELDSVITEEDEQGRPGFAEGIALLNSGRVHVMVVATSDYLPTDWVPRLEVAGDPGDAFAIPPANRPAGDRPPRQRRARPTSKS